MLLFHSRATDIQPSVYENKTWIMIFPVALCESETWFLIIYMAHENKAVLTFYGIILKIKTMV